MEAPKKIQLADSIPISGFTVVRNAQKMGYPIVESLVSLLPVVDELVVGVGQSDDNTKELIRSIQSDKIKVFDAFWDTKKTKGGLILSEKTNEALAHCQNDWCFYLQADEVIHEEDYPLIKESVLQASKNSQLEGVLFKYIHFYGSYSTIATSRKWYRNEVRIVRRSSKIQSHNDAQGFRVNGEKPKVLKSPARIFHYGWVKPPQLMATKSILLNRWWHGSKRDHEFENFDYERQYGLRPFTETHPEIMKSLIATENWNFDYRRRLKDWTLKDLNLAASDALENLTGWRIGEYRPYRILADYSAN